MGRDDRVFATARDMRSEFYLYFWLELEQDTFANALTSEIQQSTWPLATAYTSRRHCAGATFTFRKRAVLGATSPQLPELSQKGMVGRSTAWGKLMVFWGQANAHDLCDLCPQQNSESFF